MSSVERNRTMRTKAWGSAIAIMAVAAFGVQPGFAAEPSMDTMWGEATGGSDVKADRVALFRDGNYGMFIPWGLYSHLGGKWKGKIFYGIGEWILRQMKIPIPEYIALADEFAVAKSKGLGSDDLVEVAQAAAAGRVATLLIEANRKIAGRLDGLTGQVEATDLGYPQIDDLLEDLSELVGRKGGRTLAIPAEQMPVQTGLAAIYRY